MKVRKRRILKSGSVSQIRGSPQVTDGGDGL
jgi:hypothetical protein